jgi:hypothetical protein
VVTEKFLVTGPEKPVEMSDALWARAMPGDVVGAPVSTVAISVSPAKICLVEVAPETEKSLFA